MGNGECGPGLEKVENSWFKTYVHVVLVSFGGVVVSVLATGRKVRGFKPG
jgi:hypothetical protein